MSIFNSDEYQKKIIRLAMKEVEKAVSKGNAPFGAILVDSKGNIVGKAHNTQNSSNDPTAHAEINLLRKVGKKIKLKYLEGYRLFGNAEPCSMCSSAAVKSKIYHFYYGAPAEKSMDPWIPVRLVAEKSKEHITIVSGILKKDCEKQIFESRKKLKNKG